MIINNIEVLFVITVLFVASYYDIKYKKTPHYFWGFSLLLSIPIIIVMFFFYGIWYICFWVIVLVITVSLVYFLYLLNNKFIPKGFGGSDVKCLIFISILTPTFPSITNSAFGMYSPLIYQPLLFLPLLVLCLGSLIGFCVVLPMFIFTRKKIVLPFIPFFLLSYLLFLIMV